MKALKPIIVKKSAKEDRERRVLLGLIEYYLKTGKPVGSNTLKDAGFEDLSAATIRNYFANLEDTGYLSQQHSSGGRIPTEKAFRLYALEHIDSNILSEEVEKECRELRSSESREVAAYLQLAAEKLSQLTNSAVFLSAPRFDQDFITGLRLVGIDHSRCLCVLITDFGVIQTELLHVEKKLSAFTIKRMEDYFHWRLTGHNKPENLENEEEELAQKIYNELMVRYIVDYSNFTEEEIYRTGFSKLISYPEFQDTKILASSLALFENTHSMRLLIRECSAFNNVKYWIGSDLSTYTTVTPDCTVMAIPYRINNQIAGAIGLLAPLRIPYKEIIGLLRAFGESISEALTRNIYKFKIKYRQPQEEPLYLQKEKHHLIGQSRLFLLEDHRPMDGES